MPKQILYISPGTDLGGGEVSLLTLIANLDRSRYTPIICTYGEGRFASRANDLNCPVHIRSYGSALSQIPFIQSLRNLMKSTQTDLVHVNTLDIRAGIAARLSNLPLIGHLRVIFPTTWVDRTFVKVATRTISVSDAVRDHFCNEEGTSPQAFETIYNAVDTAAAQTINLRSELELPEDVPLLGVVGRIDPWKGMETFVEAAGQLKDDYPKTHFLIAGAPGPSQEEQDYKDTLVTKVAQLRLGERFHFLGYRSDALNIIRQLTALIVPSRILHTDQGIKTEGFGRVAAEGLAMKTPVIASRVGGLPEIIEHEKTGLLFTESHATDLANQIRRLLSEPSLASQFAREGYCKFENSFSVTCHLHKIQDLYDRLLKH